MQRPFVILLISSVFVLVSCSPPPDPDVSNFSLWKSPPAELNQAAGQSQNQAQNQAQYQNQYQDQMQNQMQNQMQAEPPQQQQQQQLPSTMQKGPMKTLTDFQSIPATQATITTSKGDITIELYRDQAPLTTANFLDLASKGFYNGIVFHRVIPNFMAQVGDPLTKDPALQGQWGTGGPGYTIPDEFAPTLQHSSEGIVSMANSGPDTGGSQFFITYEATPWLDGKHAVFGKVTTGMDILRQITQGDTIISITYQ